MTVIDRQAAIRLAEQQTGKRITRTVESLGGKPRWEVFKADGKEFLVIDHVAKEFLQLGIGETVCPDCPIKHKKGPNETTSEA